VRVKQPSGTVTFLFTDIEGSTRLLAELGPEWYRDALSGHRRLLREAFSRHGGFEVDCEGDAFFVAFRDAAEGVEAAREAQAALEPGPIRVRMGLHTGRPLLDPPKYVGEDVHVAARIMSAGHGGQVLLSKATRDSLDGVAISDLGEHRLKDFDKPVWLFQLGDCAFPPLKTISNTNLPRPASSFVGREREVGEIEALLQEGRLVTLTGPGGSGKTRLAIEAAAELVGEFLNGVFWVGLATVSDPNVVESTVAQAIGAQRDLSGHIGEREMLLLIDNVEQVIDAAPSLAVLVEACPNLTLLVTSRELLRVRGEVEYQVLPLADPDAVELFCLRSAVTAGPAVEELCRQLDNMPLALELAAARTKALSTEQILERLGERLDLFKGGRDADPRQVTLRATIEWSYDLLTPQEQQLFARLSVFAGGCMPEAAETVCEADLDTLQSLVDKSLLRHTGDRFWMLEMIREFAAERAKQLPAIDSLRHLEYFAGLAGRAAPRLSPLRDSAVLDALGRELPNFRSAFELARAIPDNELALKIAAGIGIYFILRGPATEGLAWLEHALEAGAGDIATRAHASRFAADLCRSESKLDAAEAHGQRSASLFAELGDGVGEGRALLELAKVAHDRGSCEERLSYLAGAAARFQAADDKLGGLWVDVTRSAFALDDGDFATAAEHTRTVIPALRERAPLPWLATTLANVSLAEVRLGNAYSAQKHLREALELSRQLEDGYVTASCLETAAAITLLGIGDPVDGAALLGAAAAHREEAHAPAVGAELSLVRDTDQGLCERLGPDEHARNQQRGHGLPLSEAAKLVPQPHGPRESRSSAP
jgi:predicted ATPase